jgi:hypothetical protein
MCSHWVFLYCFDLGSSWQPLLRLVLAIDISRKWNINYSFNRTQLNVVIAQCIAVFNFLTSNWLTLGTCLTDVDREGRVRRNRSRHCSHEVLLSFGVKFDMGRPRGCRLVNPFP